MHKPHFAEIVSQFSRLTGKSAAEATQFIEGILARLLLNYTADGNDCKLTATYQRLADYNQRTVNEDVQLFDSIRIAASMGSHIIVGGLWVGLEALRRSGSETETTSKLPAKIVKEYLSARLPGLQGQGGETVQ